MVATGQAQNQYDPPALNGADILDEPRLRRGDFGALRGRDDDPGGFSAPGQSLAKAVGDRPLGGEQQGRGRGDWAKFQRRGAGRGRFQALAVLGQLGVVGEQGFAGDGGQAALTGDLDGFAGVDLGPALEFGGDGLDQDGRADGLCGVLRADE